MDLPVNVSTGEVVGRYIADVIDGADPNLDPDARPVRGRIVFTASVPYLPNPTAAPAPVTIMRVPIIGVLDADGYLCTPYPGTLEPQYRGVRLIATDDPDLSVEGWTWDVTYMFEAIDGYKIAIPAHGFALPAGTTVDLTKVAKIPSSPGYSLPQAEAAALRAEAAALASAADVAEALAAAQRAADAAEATDAGVADLLGDPDGLTGGLLEERLAPKADKEDIDLSLGMKADLIDGKIPEAQLPSSVGETFTELFTGKADLFEGKLPESQIPDRLSENGLSTTIVESLASISAAPPGGGDDTTSLNAQLATAAGKTLTLKAGHTYKISDTLIIPGETVLDFNGAVLDARTMPAGTALGQRIALKSAGYQVATLPIGTPIAKGAKVINGISSTSGISVGDMVLLRNDESPIPGMTRSDRDKGEILIVQSVESATSITITTATTFAYGTTGLVITTLSTVDRVRIKSPNILLGGVGSSHNAIEIQYGRNVVITDPVIDGAEDIAINCRTVLGSVVRGGAIRRSTSGAFGNTGYGVAFVEGTRNSSVDGVDFEHCRHFVAGGGLWPAIHNIIKNCTGQVSVDFAYDCHESTMFWKFFNCSADSVAGGFVIRGQNVTVESCKITNSAGWGYKASVFDGVSEQRGIRFINNRLDGAVLGGYMIDGISDGSRKIDCEIVDSWATNPGDYAVSVANFDNMKISGIKGTGTKNHSILCRGTSATDRSKGLTLGVNEISGSAKNAYFLRDIDGVSTNGGQLLDSGAYGFEMTGCFDTNLVAPFIKGTAFGGLRIDGGSRHVIANPSVSGGMGATYDAMRVTGTSDFTVMGGKLSGPRHAIFTTTTENVVVMGVNVREAVNGTKINVDATNKVVINNLI